MEEKKVIHLDERIPKLKQDRKRKTNRRFIFFITVFFILILAIVYMESPLSSVTAIKVEGSHYLPTKQIIKKSGLTTNTNIWDIDENVVSNRLKKLPIVAGVTLETAFYNQVIIHVQEHQRVAYLKADGTYIPLLENGRFLKSKEASQLPVNAPILMGWEKGKLLEQMAEQLTKTPEAVVRAMSEIHLTPKKYYPKAVTVYMNDGMKVVLTVSNFSEKMEQYPKIIANLAKGSKGVLQLRVGATFTPYVKESDNDENQ